MEQTMIKVTINGETREYPKMTPYSEIIRDYEGKTEYPVILVTENGKLRELHKKLQHDCTLGFITAKDSACLLYTSSGMKDSLSQIVIKRNVLIV